MDLLRFRPIARLHQRLFTAAYRLHEAELDLIARLPQILREQRPDWGSEFAIGLDVGAGLGPFALQMMRYCRRVVAIEPNSAQAAYLRRALSKNVTVIEAAASDGAGKWFLVDDSKSGSWRRPLARLSRLDGEAQWRQPCTVDTVDRLVGIDVLSASSGAIVAKIDVEGGELSVLRGMTALLGSRPALLVIEIEARLNPQFRAVFDYLESAGFECLLYRGARLVGASHRDAEAMRHRAPTRFARLTGYQSNFVFLR